MRTARALSLDLDDTLLDGAGLEQSIRQVCASIASAYPTLDANELKRANGAAWMEYWQSAGDDWVLGRIDSATFSQEGWRQTLLACDCTDPEIVRRASGLHRQYARAAHRLYEDSLDLLDVAAGAGLPIALVTNGASDVQREKLEVLGIEHRFVAIVISGELGAAKPDAPPFEAAVAALGCDRRDVWHVGDNLATDVAGSLRAGLTSVWVNRVGQRRTTDDPEPCLEVDSLSQLTGLLLAMDA